MSSSIVPTEMSRYTYTHVSAAGAGAGRAHVGVLRLSDAIRAVLRLQVVRHVPRRVEHNYNVRRRDVQPQAAYMCVRARRM